MHRLNTFDDDNEEPFFNEPRRRPPRATTRRPQRSGGRQTRPPAGSGSVLQIAALLAVGLLIIFGLVLSCAGDSKAGYQSYLDAMQPLAQNSASVGDEFAKALGTPGLTLDTFKSDLANWAQQEQDDFVKAQLLQPPGPLQQAHSYALGAFSLRAAALTDIATHLDQAAQTHERGSAVAALLSGDAQHFTTSDDLWARLYQVLVTQALNTAHVTGVTVPNSQIVSNADIVNTRSLVLLYERLRTPASHGHVHGNHGSALIGTNIVLNGVTTGLSTTTATTVTCCTGLIVNAVIQNSGAFPEVQVKVTLSVKVGAKVEYTHTSAVTQLAAGAQTSVPFSHVQLLPDAFGHSARIYVSIKPVQGEAETKDNYATYPVNFLLSSK